MSLSIKIWLSNWFQSLFLEPYALLDQLENRDSDAPLKVLAHATPAAVFS